MTLNYQVKKYKDQFFTLYIEKGLEARKLNLVYDIFLDILDKGKTLDEVYIFRRKLGDRIRERI